MATGRNLQLAKQAGEYLVAAKLCQRDFIATTFTGNVPHYDIIASRPNGRHVPIQVKTIRSAKGAWQFDVAKYARITFKGRRQILGKPCAPPLPDLLCVFVILGSLDNVAPDRFFLLPWVNLQRMLIRGHRRVLKRFKGVRPRNPKSPHTALRLKHLSRYENNWDLVEEKVSPNGSTSRR